MALNLPTFYKRTGSAIVFAIIMLGGLLWNDWAFLTLICLVQFLCCSEYVRLMKKIYPGAEWPPFLPVLFQVMGLALLLSAALLVYSLKSNVSPSGFSLFTCSSYLLRLMPAVPAVFILVALLSKKEFFHSLLLMFGGLFYLVLPMICLFYMHSVDFVIPLALILMIWTNDTMAYLVGSFIGKTPFSPISPKKTWEGTIGGAVLTMIGAGLYGYFSHRAHMIDWVMLALCATVAGTLGDLLESKLKRMADVKDSGAIMPGHGGAMDRFDSLLVATPFAFVYFWFFMV